MIKKILIGLVVGVISGFFATGGGMVAVPALIYIVGLSEQKARGTSLFVILPMVITSGIFYFRNDYIDLEIGVLCAIGGIIGGYFGAKYLKKIPEIYLKVFFIVFLLYVSIKMIFFV